MRRVAVIGAGAFGTALACVIARSGRKVMLWGRDQDQMQAMTATHRNEAYLPEIDLPETLIPTTDLAVAARADILILAIPTQALRQAMSDILPYLGGEATLISAAKGIEQTSGKFVCEILAERAPSHQAAVLSGPGFAADIARGLPTAVTLAASTLERARVLAETVSGPGLRIYHTDDVRGVEIGGAAKNVLAIAAGIIAGAGLGESARASMIARGFAELRRFAAAAGAKPETLMGLSGLGDLVLTASSSQSRNFTLGLSLGQGMRVSDALSSGKLAEGAFTAPALVRMARELGVEMPLSEAVAAVLAGQLSVREAVTKLIERPQKSEI